MGAAACPFFPSADDEEEMMTGVTMMATATYIFCNDAVKRGRQHDTRSSIFPISPSSSMHIYTYLDEGCGVKIVRFNTHSTRKYDTLIAQYKNHLIK